MVRNIYHIVEKTALFFWHLLFRICGKEIDDEKDKGFLQFVRFGLVGLSNTLVSYAIYSLTLIILRGIGILQGIDYYAAQFVSFVLSVAWSFYWNNRYVFKKGEGESRSVFASLIKAYVTYSFTGLFLNSLLLWLWVNIFGISAFLAPIINLIVTVPINYILNKFWAFK